MRTCSPYFRGQYVPAVTRPKLEEYAGWFRKQAAQHGYAWRQRRRAQRLLGLRGSFLPCDSAVGDAVSAATGEVRALLGRFQDWRLFMALELVLQRGLLEDHVAATLSSFLGRGGGLRVSNAFYKTVTWVDCSHRWEKGPLQLQE